MHRGALTENKLTGFEPPELAVRRQPLELRARGAPDEAMCSKPIDEIF
jgi:hypothetical protein